jgi:2-keto-4-pentenoate hydratase/2-oxohepta-3-ene-1,7-dioic acid hydratase in catechol pathway
MLLARASIGGDIRAGEIDGDTFHVVVGDLFAGGERSGQAVSLGDLDLLSPTQPRKVLVQMMGFREEGVPLPPDAVPWLLPKLASPVTGDGADIVCPAFVAALYMEPELAVVIGKPLHSASNEEAREAIFGFTCFNDVTAPQFMFTQEEPELQADSDFFRAKSIDTFASMGPWIRTDLTEGDVERGLAISVAVNGQRRAEGSTRLLKYSVSTWISFASTYVTLLPGDVISLGTPAPCEAQPGDQVEIEVEGIGVLHNRVVAA